MKFPLGMAYFGVRTVSIMECIRFIYGEVMVESLNSLMIACRMLQGQLERACFHLFPIMLDVENGFEVKKNTPQWFVGMKTCNHLSMSLGRQDW